MRFIETSLYEVSINMWALEKMSPSHFFIWITLCDKHNNNRQKIISALRAALFACSVTLRKYACYWNTRLLSIVPFLSPEAASTSRTSYGKLLGYCSIMHMWIINGGVISINTGRLQFTSKTRGDSRIDHPTFVLPLIDHPRCDPPARHRPILQKKGYMMLGCR